MGLRAISRGELFDNVISLIKKNTRSRIFSLFCVALDVSNMGGDLHCAVWFWPKAVVYCAVQGRLKLWLVNCSQINLFTHIGKKGHW